MSNTPPRPLRAFERAFLAAEQPPWDALYRIAIGYGMVPVFSRLSGTDDLGWGLLASFVALLLALRIGPAVLRKLLPFSQEATAMWAERRGLAKRFDSYQWRKLLWFGVGLAAQMASSGRVDWPRIVLLCTCVGGGAVGLVIWRQRVSAGLVSGQRSQ
jgi:hypothetical protein